MSAVLKSEFHSQLWHPTTAICNNEAQSRPFEPLSQRESCTEVPSACWVSPLSHLTVVF